MEWVIVIGFVWVSLMLVGMVVAVGKRLRRLAEQREVNNRALIKTATELDRGTTSERRLVLELLKLGYPSSNIFHDLYLESGGGRYSQSDVVMITKAGIIVFEVKDYSGWLFGRGYQTYWTQVLNYGKEKYRFYNPVIQNNAHIEAIRHRIPQLASIPIYSVIVFYGSCTLRNVSQIPREVSVIYSEGIARTVSEISERGEIQYVDLEGVRAILNEAVENGANPEVRDRHARNIQDQLLRIHNRAYS